MTTIKTVLEKVFRKTGILFDIFKDNYNRASGAEKAILYIGIFLFILISVYIIIILIRMYFNRRITVMGSLTLKHVNDVYNVNDRKFVPRFFLKILNVKKLIIAEDSIFNKKNKLEEIKKQVENDTAVSNPEITAIQKQLSVLTMQFEDKLMKNEESIIERVEQQLNKLVESKINVSNMEYLAIRKQLSEMNPQMDENMKKHGESIITRIEQQLDILIEAKNNAPIIQVVEQPAEEKETINAVEVVEDPIVEKVEEKIEKKLPVEKETIVVPVIAKKVKSKKVKQIKKSKGELIDYVSAETGLSKAKIQKSITALEDIITSELVAKEKVKLNGLGQFSVIMVKDRVGTNPSDGSKILIPAHQKVKFKGDQILNDLLNGVTEIDYKSYFASIAKDKKDNSKKRYQITKHPKNGWQLKKEGAKRAYKNFDTEAEAIEFAKKNIMNY